MPQPNGVVLADARPVLYLDGVDDLPILDKEVDFGACLRSIEREPGRTQLDLRPGHKLSRNEPLKRCALADPGIQVFLPAQAGKPMQNATVPDINLGALLSARST